MSNNLLEHVDDFDVVLRHVGRCQAEVEKAVRPFVDDREVMRNVEVAQAPSEFDIIVDEWIFEAKCNV